MLLLLLACTAAGPSQGELSALTYNVAGLPQGVSSSDPEANIPQISPLLNAWDLVLAQEDFAYHAELASEADHPHQSPPKEPVERLMGDGLSRFSRFPFEPVEHVQWVACYGTLEGASDCLAEKGFSFARTTLAPGVEVDVYNLHAEAGGGPEDNEARIAGIDQLLEFLAERSDGRALIIGGDTNMSRGDVYDDPLLDRLIAEGGLSDACVEVACPIDKIDRFFLRGSEEVALEALDWRIADEFVTDGGADLSDHLAISARIGWSLGE